MPTCHNDWSYLQTLKKSFTLDPAMPCPYCGTNQFLTKTTRRKTGILNFLPALVILLPSLFDVSIMISVLFLLITLTAMVAIYPTLVELSNQEEPIF
ncbi:TIGR04104 family putative zinc finger protein [Gracilibacillus sp. D59]|uniref:TIGR04104 family putative zinc finger protein n=1 Tax=Gracilibacillus sp. D59 TaxID=3457434 RepID=UPI003FCCC8E5